MGNAECCNREKSATGTGIPNCFEWPDDQGDKRVCPWNNGSHTRSASPSLGRKRALSTSSDDDDDPAHLHVKTPQGIPTLEPLLNSPIPRKRSRGGSMPQGIKHEQPAMKDLRKMMCAMKMTHALKMRSEGPTPSSPTLEAMQVDPARAGGLAATPVKEGEARDPQRTAA